MFNLFLFISLSVYALFCLLLTWVWLFWKKERACIHPRRRISVIVPVRNESENILNLLQDLERQTLKKADFQVIIANDNSSDNTKSIVEDFILKSKLNLLLLNLSDKKENNSPKKRAISESLEIAVGEIIVTTDGDCRLSRTWLESISSSFQKSNAVFISAPVYFIDQPTASFRIKLWNAIQQIEFGSLIVSGACSMKLKQENMCSGANMAYLKSAFYEVDGFTGNEEIGSGDDEFLMHKMAAKFPNQVHYLKTKKAIVLSKSSANWANFYMQRKRWAGKWRNYDSWSPKLMAVFIFGINLICILAFFTGQWWAFGIKITAEFLFLSVSLLFFNKAKLVPLIPLVQLIYPFYVVFFGLLSLKNTSYIWKERKLK